MKKFENMIPLNIICQSGIADILSNHQLLMGGGGMIKKLDSLIQNIIWVQTFMVGFSLKQVKHDFALVMLPIL